MRRKLLQALIVGCNLPVFLFSQDDWSLNNQLTISGEFVYMRRNPLGHDHALVIETPCEPPPLEPCICPPCKEPPPPPPPFKEVVGTRDLLKKLDFQPGYRVGLWFSPSHCYSVEGSYLRLEEWQVNKKHCGECCNLRFPFCPIDCTCNYVDANQALILFTSHFSTAEANYWAHVTPRRCNYFSYSWLLGFRYFNLDESLNLGFVKGGTRGNYIIHTDNDLYGGQFGVNVQINPYPSWSWDFTLKGGILANEMQQRTFLGDRGNTVTLRDYSKSETIAAYMGDGALRLTAQLFRHLNLYIGYELIYLANLALATEQLEDRLGGACCFERSKKLNTRGDIFIQGGFFGLGLGF